MHQQDKGSIQNDSLKQGCLYVVSTPIGNLGDFSSRAADTLKSVDIIAAEDTRKASILKQHFNITTKVVSYYEHNAQRRIPQLINYLVSGSTVALITDAGTPGIADPGYRLINSCIEQSIAIVPIPGPAAFLAALSVSGLPTDRFVFEGFLPVKKGRKKRLVNLAGEWRTLLFYESPHRIQRTLQDLYDHFGNREVVVLRELTKMYEEIIRTTLQDAQQLFEQRKPKGEFVLVIRGCDQK